MLDANIKTQLDTYLKNLVNPIEITVSVNDGAKAQELLSLATEIAELSEKITLSKNTGSDGGRDGQTRRAL